MNSVMFEVLDKPLEKAKPWWHYFISWHHADGWPVSHTRTNSAGFRVQGYVWHGLTTLAGPLVLEEIE